MVLDRVLKSDVDWEHHTLWLRNWKVVLMESIKGCDWDVEKNCDHCMTLRHMDHRAMITG